MMAKPTAEVKSRTTESPPHSARLQRLLASALSWRNGREFVSRPRLAKAVAYLARLGRFGDARLAAEVLSWRPRRRTRAGIADVGRSPFFESRMLADEGDGVEFCLWRYHGPWSEVLLTRKVRLAVPADQRWRFVFLGALPPAVADVFRWASVVIIADGPASGLLALLRGREEATMNDIKGDAVPGLFAFSGWIRLSRHGEWYLACAGNDRDTVSKELLALRVRCRHVERLVLPSCERPGGKAVAR